MIGSPSRIPFVIMSSSQHRRSRRGKHDPHALEFPDPGRWWRLFFIVLALVAAMAVTTVLMRKMAKVGDLREETDFRKSQSHRIR